MHYPWLNRMFGEQEHEKHEDHEKHGKKVEKHHEVKTHTVIEHPKTKACGIKDEENTYRVRGLRC